MSVIGQEEGIVHGTLKGYKQHRYRKVDACEPCLEAVREDNAKRYAERRANPVERTDAQAAWYGGKFRHKKGPSKPSANAERDTARVVAAWSKDATECRELLDMLGLFPVLEGGEGRG